MNTKKWPSQEEIDKGTFKTALLLFKCTEEKLRNQYSENAKQLLENANKATDKKKYRGAYKSEWLESYQWYLRLSNIHL